MPVSRVKRIVALEERADRHDQQADECRWEAARLVSEELAAGKTQRQLAQEIGKSQPHVGRMNRVWQDHGDTHGHQSFDALYQKAKAPKKAPAAQNEPTGATEKPQRRAPRQKAPAKSPSEPELPALLSKPSADELASEAEHALKSIEPAKLTELGWKYLDRAQERLSVLFDHLQESGHVSSR